MTNEIVGAGTWGRAIFETAKESVDNPAFADAWRTYSANAGFPKLPQQSRTLIRIAFVAGWRAALVERNQ